MTLTTGIKTRRTIDADRRNHQTEAIMLSGLLTIARSSDEGKSEGVHMWYERGFIGEIIDTK